MVVEKISYSSLMQFKQCPHLFYLNNIVKAKAWQNTIHTVFGTLVHKHVQKILELKGGEEEEIKKFSRTWKKLCSIYKKQIESQTTSAALFSIAGVNILTNIRNEMDKAFINWKMVSIEKRLKTLPLFEKNIYFTGFIDSVIEYEEHKKNKKTGKIKIKNKYAVLDFKTCASAFYFKRYKDKFKDMQLIYYKYFYSEELKINQKLIETFFILLEKNHKTKKPITVLRIPSTNRTINIDLEFLKKSMSHIQVCEKKENFPKNRSACYNQSTNEPQCAFYNTIHCPSFKI